MSRKVWIILGALLILGVTAVLAIFLYVFRTDRTDMLRQKTDYALDASALYHDFANDEAAAMEKYAGKIIEISGAVESIEKNEWGNVTISFVDQIFGVTCTIDSLDVVKQTEIIGEIKNGESLVVKGRCDGMLTDVKIVKCVIVK